MATPVDDDTHLTAAATRRRRRLRVPAAGPVFGSLASAAFAQVALVITGVITARALGPADRGYLALVILVPTVLVGVGTLGLPRAVTYFIASDPEQERSVLRAIRSPVVLQAVFLTALQCAFLAVIVAGEPERVKWTAVAVLPLLAANLADLYGKAILQGQHRYAAFNVLRNAGITLYLIGVLLIVALGEAGLVEFGVAYVAANVVAGIVTLSVALTGRPRDTGHGATSRRELLRFGLRGYLGSLSPVGTFRLDQALVGLALSPYALGLYVVGLAFTNLPMFISRSIGFIAFPQVAGATGDDETMRRFLWFSIILSGSAVLVLELTAGWLVPFFFGSAFDGAVPLARILLIGAFFEGARQVLTDTSSGRGRPGLSSIAELASWCILIPSVAILLPAWDAEGVAAATTIAAAGSFAILVLLVRRSGASRSSDPTSPRESD